LLALLVIVVPAVIKLTNFKNSLVAGYLAVAITAAAI